MYDTDYHGLADEDSSPRCKHQAIYSFFLGTHAEGFWDKGMSEIFVLIFFQAM